MYKGRFAPSPTGPLHFGSLVAALASFLDARYNQGTWQVRLDDIDPPRHDRSSFQTIPDCLEQHGLFWDNDLLLQSRRKETHEFYISKLRRAGRIFTCTCTRTTLGPLGQCQSDCPEKRHGQGSIRLHLSDATEPGFTDLVLGPQIPTVMPKNFVMKRRDGLIAYQLATAVDDIDEGYTHIIRGSDLLDSTFRQMAIHEALGKLSPRYGHLPLVTDSFGNKLSKQAGAQAVDETRPVANLRLALDFLNQTSPPSAAKSVGDVLNFATEHWRLNQLNQG